jgi:hypothetical protein
MELGLDTLALAGYTFQHNVMGKPHTTSGLWPINKVCSDFVCTKHTEGKSPDRFLKERISFVELAFRIREEELTDRERSTMLGGLNFDDLIDFGSGMRIHGKPGEGRRASNRSPKAEFLRLLRGCQG